jgi:hypothetical protein
MIFLRDIGIVNDLALQRGVRQPRCELQDTNVIRMCKWAILVLILAIILYLVSKKLGEPSYKPTPDLGDDSVETLSSTTFVQNPKVTRRPLSEKLLDQSERRFW